MKLNRCVIEIKMKVGVVQAWMPAVWVSPHLKAPAQFGVAAGGIPLQDGLHLNLGLITEDNVKHLCFYRFFFNKFCII